MIVFDPSIYWQGVCKHLVDDAPSVDIVRCSKNPLDAREKNIQQRAKSLSLAGAKRETCADGKLSLVEVVVLGEYARNSGNAAS